MSHIDENTPKVRKELMFLASSNVLLSSIALFINALIIIIVFWNLADKYFLLLWIFSLFGLLALRYKNAKNYLKNHEKLSLEKEEKLFKIKAFLTAFIVSIGISYLLPTDKLFHQAFLVMIIAGLSAGSVMSLSTHKYIAKYYLMILLLPFTYFMFKFGTDMHILMALLITLFLILLITFSKEYHNRIVQVIVSKYLIEQTQKEKKVSEDNFHTIFKEAPIGVFTYDKNLIIKQANQTFASYLNVSLQKLIDLDMKQLSDQLIGPTLNIALKGQRGFYEGSYNTTLSREHIWIKMQTVPMYDTNNNIIGGLGIVEDITKRIESEQKIRHQAFYDHLTGLPNRLTLNDRLEQQLARLSRHNRFGAVLFIDLDHFKTINDSLGHHIGDTLLKNFASRAQAIIRKEDTVARLGGDEFIILLSDLSSNEYLATEHAHKTANKLHELMKKPIVIEEHTLHVTLSIGINIISSKEDNVNDILKHADIAMYQAKESGRNTTCFYKDEMSKQIQKRLILNNELREALRLNQFELYFQPIVNIDNCVITSCEALIRWNHPEKGLIFPDHFIPYAEESDLIIDIGDWVIDAACKQYKNFATEIIDIAINISSRQFIQDDFIEKILKTTKANEIHPSALKLELTESVAIDNLADTVKKMNILKSHGFKIAMDDFGTGYSSLSYLKNLPFDFIKIDRSFIKDMLENEDDASLIKTILTISKQLKFAVIAEGVETQEHVAVLKALECDYYQGYVKSKPIPADEFNKLLTKISQESGS